MIGCLSEALRRAGTSARLSGRSAELLLSKLQIASALADPVESYRGRCVLLVTEDQLGTATALLELDGVARRVVLCTPDLNAQQLAWVSKQAEADTLLTDSVTDAAESEPSRLGVERRRISSELKPLSAGRDGNVPTEWILLTSGTSGTPKLVLHTLKSLTGALTIPVAANVLSAARPTVWSTFYDIRRYGGLQIYLRAVLSGASLVLSSAAESTDDFLARAASARVTHISGTPSHWRRALMSGTAATLSPDYVRLSGEIADQPVLDALKDSFPEARIGHAFASTEAGVAFDVNDGCAGFPASLLENAPNGIEMKVEDGTLRIRSNRTAARYLGSAAALSQDDGFVDTGDLVEQVDDRYYFRGRRGGVINVGGLKVYPEEVEEVLNADARVRMSRVSPRRSPITGAIVVADIVLADGTATDDATFLETLKAELTTVCRQRLAAHKVPTSLRIVPALAMTAAGKLVRAGA